MAHDPAAAAIAKPPPPYYVGNLTGRARSAAIGLLAWALAACGDDGGAPARVAVLSAFPGELAAVLARTAVEETVAVEGRRVRLGRLGGTPVVVAMTGIGLVNAATTTRALLERFPLRGVVVSGVAGSLLRIGDVAVPARWSLPDGSAHPIARRWLAIAERLADGGALPFERCTAVPSESPDPVCLDPPPVLVVGGEGASADPFAGAAFPCRPGAGDVFGCDVAARAAAPPAPLVEDMESAAIAAEAAARGVPFIAFRGVSDGAGDPLGLPGFPAQFYAYYRLAAANAAAAVEAFAARL
jgi:nucleoside phosphorylase